MKTLTTTLILLAWIICARADFYGNKMTTTNDAGVNAALMQFGSTNPVPAGNVFGPFPTNPTVGPQGMPVLTNEPAAIATSNSLAYQTAVVTTNTANIAGVSNAVSVLQQLPNTAPFTSNSISALVLNGNNFTNVFPKKMSLWVSYRMAGTNALVQFTNYSTHEGWLIAQSTASVWITNWNVFRASLSTNDVAQVITNNEATLQNCGFDQ